MKNNSNIVMSAWSKYFWEDGHSLLQRSICYFGFVSRSCFIALMTKNSAEESDIIAKLQ